MHASVYGGGLRQRLRCFVLPPSVRVKICSSLGAAFLACALGTRVFHRACLGASERLHNAMLGAVVASPFAFFDTHPTGRILNR